MIVGKLKRLRKTGVSDASQMMTNKGHIAEEVSHTSF